MGFDPREGVGENLDAYSYSNHGKLMWNPWMGVVSAYEKHGMREMWICLYFFIRYGRTRVFLYRKEYSTRVIVCEKCSEVSEVWMAMVSCFNTRQNLKVI